MGTEMNSNMISRREILKRGAFVGGAVLWVTPVVQAVGMGPAYAKIPSPGCSRYCIKWDVGTNTPPTTTNPPLTCRDGSGPAYPIWGDTWTELGTPPSGQQNPNALTCPDDGVNDGVNDGGSALYVTKSALRPGKEFVVYEDKVLGGFWIAFPADVKLADLTDVGLFSVGAKCGEDKVKLSPKVKEDPCLKDLNDIAFNRIHIPAKCGSSTSGISHIEMIVDLCETPQ